MLATNVVHCIPYTANNHSLILVHHSTLSSPSRTLSTPKISVASSLNTSPFDSSLYASYCPMPAQLYRALLKTSLVIWFNKSSVRRRIAIMEQRMSFWSRFLYFFSLSLFFFLPCLSNDPLSHGIWYSMYNFLLNLHSRKQNHLTEFFFLLMHSSRMLFIMVEIARQCSLTPVGLAAYNQLGKPRKKLPFNLILQFSLSVSLSLCALSFSGTP